MPDWILFFIVVVGLPVVAGVGGDVFKRWIKLKEKQLEHAAKLAATQAAAEASHVERLEQRVRVLERIATDQGTHLAAQILDLRDDKLN